MISVVIVTFNSAGDIRACLEAVKAQRADSLEIIVVDNASTDATTEIVRALCPQAVLIVNEQNKGAAFARNQAIALACGEWVLTLDSDVVLGEGFMESFRNAKDAWSDDVGMVQPNILSLDYRRVYSQGIRVSGIYRFFDVNRGRIFPCRRGAEREIVGPCSAAAFYRRKMLERLKEVTGYFDERFFFLVEDVDLACRAKRRGWKVVFMPGMVCGHGGDGSRTGRRYRRYLCWRNRHLMIAKHEGFWGRLGVYVLSAPYEILRVADMYFGFTDLEKEKA